MRSVIYRASQKYAEIEGIKYDTPAEKQAADKAFIEALLWHDNTGVVPQFRKEDGDFQSLYTNIGTLSEAMVFVIVEGVRQSIERATRDQFISGMQFTPAMKKYYIDAYEELNDLQAKLLEIVRNPEGWMVKASACGHRVPIHSRDESALFLTEALSERILELVMEPLKVLFTDFPVIGRNFVASDLLKDKMYRHNNLNSLQGMLFLLMLNTIWKTGVTHPAGDEIFSHIHAMERVLQATLGVGYDVALQRLLKANGLIRIGSSWRGPDGYDYFEVSDGKSDKTILCRVYHGEMGVIFKGIEIFMAAELDGEVPNPAYPATSTGTLGDLQAKAIDLPSYQQWLAAHPRIRTKYLDEFYTHYAYPTT
jgi:hypothetical protein